MDPVDLDPAFLMKVRNYRALGSAGKINPALSALPRFPASPMAVIATDFRADSIGADIDYLERASDTAKYGDYSPSPYMDVTIPH